MNEWPHTFSQCLRLTTEPTYQLFLLTWWLFLATKVGAKGWEGLIYWETNGRER